MADKVANRDFETLLEQLKHGRGFDFTGYKRTTLMRRVEKRMADVGIDSFTDYSDYLEVHPDEFRALFNTILINVTSFFRDPEAWETLFERVIKPIAEDRARPIRIWSAGCASGQETYTLVMLLAEAMGVDRFKDHVKVYATDADADALNIARQARYSTKEMADVPEELRLKYFEPNTHGWVFRADLRRCVIFGEHDLVQDAPISRIDLLVCRNTLIYFNSETQARIVARLHFALAREGKIFLGKSEMLLTHSRLFHAIDVKSRIFQKLPNASVRDRLLVLATDSQNGDSGEDGIDLREASFNAGPVAQVVVDRKGLVVLANQQARDVFRIVQNDIGKPIQHLEISYRPVEIRSRIEQAYTSRATVELLDVEYRLPHGEYRYYDIRVTPLIENGREAVGASICYVEVTSHHRLRMELERTTHEVEAAYEELQATNEELETTNEELQSTIEELETTNEELQSTNEELETMNEELHSTNEELETINEELRRRTGELHTVNDFMEAIMTSMRAGVVVTDHDMHVILWSTKAEELWGLRREEVEGKVLTNLDIGLPLNNMSKQLKACLDGKADSEQAILKAVNRRGRTIDCRVSCTRLLTSDNRSRGLILLMEEWHGAS